MLVTAYGVEWVALELLRERFCYSVNFDLDGAGPAIDLVIGAGNSSYMPMVLFSVAG